LFNRFEKLKDASLAQRIRALMDRAGLATSGLFVMDGSRRSAHGNAYFTGFGAAKRVVFYDTLLARLAPAEIEAVLAHELGHFKLRHIRKRMVAMAIVTLLFFALLGWLATRAWFFTGLGVAPNLAAPNDGLALLLLMLAAPVFAVFAAPLASRWSRRDEFEADAFACVQADPGDPRAVTQEPKAPSCRSSLAPGNSAPRPAISAASPSPRLIVHTPRSSGLLR